MIVGLSYPWRLKNNRTGYSGRKLPGRFFSQAVFRVATHFRRPEAQPHYGSHTLQHFCKNFTPLTPGTRYSLEKVPKYSYNTLVENFELNPRCRILEAETGIDRT